MRLAWAAALPLVISLSCGLPSYDFDQHATADASADGASGSAGGGSGGGSGGAGGGSAAGGTGASAGSAGGGGTGGVTTCQTHADCSSPTPKCNPATSTCVPCLPTEDECPAGYYCAVTNCAPGCKTSSECDAPLVCDPIQHKCLGCTSDDDCAAGKICETTTTECIDGCKPSHACPAGLDCCSGKCAALAIDPDNCGSCGNVCPTPANGKRVCKSVGGNIQCDVECTELGTADCNGEIPDGCEVNVQNDPNNCGGCNAKCPSGQTCVNKVCQ